MSTEGIKGPARNWIAFVLGSQIGPTGTEEDTYVAVLERAPQKIEEVMIVFASGEMPTDGLSDCSWT